MCDGLGASGLTATLFPPNRNSVARGRGDAIKLPERTVGLGLNNIRAYVVYNGLLFLGPGMFPQTGTVGTAPETGPGKSVSGLSLAP